MEKRKGRVLLPLRSPPRGSANGLMELASQFEALLMAVITENSHIRGQVDALRECLGRYSSPPERSMPASSVPTATPQPLCGLSDLRCPGGKKVLHQVVLIPGATG